jgi:hypothetical protein
MDNGNSGSGNGMLYFLVGALCVAVAVGGYFMFNHAGGTTGGSASVAQSPAPAASAPAPTETRNITIEKKVVEPTRIIEQRR